jgi:hypothetical protein
MPASAKNLKCFNNLYPTDVLNVVSINRDFARVHLTLHEQRRPVTEKHHQLPVRGRDNIIGLIGAARQPISGAWLGHE